MTPLNIKPSGCGAYIVCLVGAYPQVIPMREAIALRDLYRLEERRQGAAGNTILEEHERQMAHVLSGAIVEAASFSETTRRLVLEAGG
jgi:hypothetical protein